MITVTEYFAQRGSRHWTFSDDVELVADIEPKHRWVRWTLHFPEHHLARRMRDLNSIGFAGADPLRRAVLTRSPLGQPYWSAVQAYRQLSQGERDRIELHQLMGRTKSDTFRTECPSPLGPHTVTGVAIDDDETSWTIWSYITANAAAVIDALEESYAEAAGSYGGPGQAFRHAPWARRLSPTELFVTQRGGYDV